jgi:hypothetical protein
MVTSFVGYLYSNSSVSGVTVCHQGSKVCRSVHVYPTGPSCTGSDVCAKLGRIGRISSGSGPEERITFVRYLSSNSGVTDTSFGVPSPDTFFVGVEDCAIDVAVRGVLAKLLEDAKDSDAINTQQRITAHLAG